MLPLRGGDGGGGRRNFIGNKINEKNIVANLVLVPSSFVLRMMRRVNSKRVMLIARRISSLRSGGSGRAARGQIIECCATETEINFGRFASWRKFIQDLTLPLMTLTRIFLSFSLFFLLIFIADAANE